MSDSDQETVLLVGQNLFFLGRVETLAEPLGYDVRRAATESAFWGSYGARKPALILVDLEGDESIWSKVLEGINQEGASQRESGRARIVAFGPHEDLATMERARSLGCDLVLSKGEFNRDLPEILANSSP